jgi:hypothetical protein
VPFSRKVDHDRKRIYSRAFGDISSSDVLKATLETLQDPVMSTYDEMMDARDIGAVDFSSEASRDLSEVVKNLKVRPGRRFAIVVSSDLAMGLANQYRIFMEITAGDSIRVGVFRDAEEAEDWAFGG